MMVQSNLVNSKSSGLEVLFRSIENSKCREEDIKIYDPNKVIFLIKHKFWARKRNVSMR